MPEPGPTPLQSFLGGVGLALPVQALLSLNSKTFGISGFIQGAVRGNLEDILSVLGMVAGGSVVGAIEGIKPTIQDSAPLPLILSGLLVGIGAKVRFKSPAKVSVYHLISSADGQRLHVWVLPVSFLCLEISNFTHPTLPVFSRRHMICGLSCFSVRSVGILIVAFLPRTLGLREQSHSLGRLPQPRRSL
jgi:hypothetical protein